MLFRMIFGLPGAAFVTALLFLAMGWMIRQEGPPPQPVENPDFSILAKLKPTPPRPRYDPPPRDPAEPPPETKIDFPKSKNPGGPGEIGPLPGPEKGGTGPIGDMTGTQPTIRIPPSYPENCRARGAQGVVMVEFDVTPEGTVVNPRVVASENSCLDRAAMQTISKWKYTPKTDSSGRAVAQRGLRQSFNFQLTDA